MLKVALIQHQCSSEKKENIEKASAYIREASANGAKIICLPELFTSIYFCFEINEKYFREAEPIPGPTINSIRRVAEEQQVVVIAPIFEQTPASEFYNTATIIGPNGEIIGRYRKMSIPSTPSGTMIGMVGMEKYYFKPGNLGFPVFKTPFGVNIGVLICYDRHFPEAGRALALGGADIVFIPTATANGTKYLWEIELKSRAVENVYYIGAVNRVGYDIGGADFQRFYGGSMFVNPKGEVVSQAGSDNDEIVYADLDLSIIQKLRDAWGFFSNRRPDAYGVLCK